MAIFAVIVAVCVLSSIILLIMAWLAPEIDDNGRFVRSEALASPSIVPLDVSERIEMPLMKGQVIPMRFKMSQRAL